MKKIYYLIATVIMALTFTSCEDVPAPFGQPVNPNTGAAEEDDVVESNFEAGKYFFIMQIDGVYKEGVPVASGNTYGYITFTDATITDGKLVGKEANLFTFTKEDNGYFTIQDASGRYYYMTGSYTSFNVDASQKDAYLWKIDIGTDGNATITNKEKGKVIDYASNYKNLSPASNGDGLPMLLKQGASLSGGTAPTPSADEGSLEAPKTVADALAAIEALAEGATTDANYFVKGKVAKITTDASKIGTDYKDINYLISADGTETNTLTIYKGKNLNNTDFTAANQLAVGDDVVVYGKLQKYKNSNNAIVPQMISGNYLVKTSNTNAGSGDTGGGDTGGGTSTATSLTNGDFETWADGQPTGWKSASSASSATLAQSTDPHGGSYAVIVKGGGTANKRLASQEISLTAGSYNFSFWVKATTANKAQCCAGYVPVTNGTAGSYQYKKNGTSTVYETLSTTWSQVSYDFTLDADATICLVVMNPKSGNYSSGEDILVDDATLTKK